MQKDTMEYRNMMKDIFKCYMKRFKTEILIVDAYYKQKKSELEAIQKIHYKERAKENIKCPYCDAEFKRTNLSRHRKTNPAMYFKAKEYHE